MIVFSLEMTPLLTDVAFEDNDAVSLLLLEPLLRNDLEIKFKRSMKLLLALFVRLADPELLEE